MAWSQLHGRTGLVDQVDGLVWQEAPGDMLGAGFHSEVDGFIGVCHAVVFLVDRLELGEDMLGLGDGGLGDIDLLEPAEQSLRPGEVSVELLIGRGADEPDVTGL